MTTTNSQTRDEQSAAVGLLKVLRRRMAIILVCACAVPAGALVFSLFQENQYSTSASLLFRDPQFDQKLFGNTVVPANVDPSREAATNVELVSLDVVAERTAHQIGGGLTGSEVKGGTQAPPARTRSP